MAIGRDSSTGAQNRDEKKDHPRGDGEWRGDNHERDMDDAKDQQAKGDRNFHSQPGPKGGPPSSGGQPAKTDNTRSHGNRPKGVNQGAQDHD